jgi:hypothetical protein
MPTWDSASIAAVLDIISRHAKPPNIEVTGRGGTVT